MKTWLQLVVAITLFAVGSSPAGTFKDGPFVGYVSGGDVEDEGVALGWQAAYEYNDYLQLEGGFSWQEDEDTRFSSSQPGVPSAALDTQLLGFSLTAKVGARPTENTYLYTGGGVTYYEIDGDADRIRMAENAMGDGPFGFFDVDFDKEWGSHFVLGFEVVLTRRWEVFAEYRHLYLEPNVQVRFAPDRDTATTSRSDTYDYDHSMLRFGVNYRF